MAESELLTLPPHLLENITEQLPLGDKKSFRSCSRTTKLLVGDLPLHFAKVQITFAKTNVHVSLRLANGTTIENRYFKNRDARLVVMGVVEDIVQILNRRELKIDEMVVSYGQREFFEPQSMWDELEAAVYEQEFSNVISRAETIQLMLKIQNGCNYPIGVKKFIALITQEQENFCPMLAITDFRNLDELVIGRCFGGTTEDLGRKKPIQKQHALRPSLFDELLWYAHRIRLTKIKNFVIESCDEISRIKSMHAYFVNFKTKNLKEIVENAIGNQAEHINFIIRTQCLNQRKVKSALRRVSVEWEDTLKSFAIVVQGSVIRFYRGAVRQNHEDSDIVVTERNFQKWFKEKEDESEEDGAEEEEEELDDCDLEDEWEEEEYDSDDENQENEVA